MPSEPALQTSNVEDEAIAAALAAQIPTQPTADITDLVSDLTDQPTADSPSGYERGTATAPVELEDDDDDANSSNAPPSGTVQPMGAAKQFLSGFLQTLLYKEQRSVFSEHATKYLVAFAQYYHDSKSILQAEGDLAYASRRCTVTIPFQPMNGIKEGTACKAFVNELAEVTKNMKIEAGKLYLRGKRLNLAGRKNELLELFAKALPSLAQLILVETELSTIGKHDLVADLLLYHHKDALGHLDNIPVPQFIEIYKKVNRCGGPTVDTNTIYCEFFPENSTEDKDSDGVAAEFTVGDGTTIDASQETPLHPRNLQQQLNNSKMALPGRGRGRGILPPSTDFVTALTALRQMSTPAAVAAINELQREQALAKKAAATTSAPETNANPPSEHPSEQPTSNPDDQPPAQQNTTTPSNRQPETTKPTPSTAASKTAPTKPSEPSPPNHTRAVPTQSPPVQPQTNTQKRSETVLSPVKTLVNPYTGGLYFSRSETEAELDSVKQAELKFARLEECGRIAATNSIRTPRLAIRATSTHPPPPDDGPPPTYAPIPNFGMPTTPVAPKPPTNTFTPPAQAKESLSKLLFVVKRCFAQTQAAFIQQSQFNVKSARMLKAAADSRLQESAQATATKLIVESADPTKPALQENVRKQVAKETQQDKKRVQQVEHQLADERAKRAKLDKRVQFLEEALKKSKSKEHSGPPRGASTKKSTGPPKTSTGNRPQAGRNNQGRGKGAQGGQGGRGSHGGWGQGHQQPPQPPKQEPVVVDDGGWG